MYIFGKEKYPEDFHDETHIVRAVKQVQHDGDGLVSREPELLL